jgi:hypothetical protein
VIVSLFLLVGGVIAPQAREQLGDPDQVGVFIGTVIQLLARSKNVRPLGALPAVPTGCPLVRFGLLPERFGMQLPGVLGSLPSRLSTITVPKALLQLGPLARAVLGAVRPAS